MRRAFATRALILLLCVAVLSLLATSSDGSPYISELVPFVILFALLIAWSPNPRRDPDGRGQPLSFLTLDTSRAPPTA